MKKFISFLFITAMGWSLMLGCLNQSSLIKLAEAFSAESR